MLRKHLRAAALAALLTLLWTTTSTTAGAGPSLDSPTILSKSPLTPAEGVATVAGETGAGSLGFPAHLYTASQDGIVRIVMEVRNQNPKANNGMVYRAYMRVLSRNDNAEARSTNGHRFGDVARAELVFHVKKGEVYAVVATLGLHIEGASRAKTNYTLTATELAQ